MGRGARGVRGMRLQEGQSLISLLVAESDQQTVLVAFAAVPTSSASYVLATRMGGHGGYVADFSWRSTRVRMLSNNIVVVPNALLAKAVVVNHHLPSTDLAVLVEVGVDYASDLGHVERVVVEVGRTVMADVPGGVPDFEPFVRFHTFADSSINFTTILRADEYVGQYLVKHEFVKRLHARFKAEGIVIPFPIRTLHHATAVGLPPPPGE